MSNVMALVLWCIWALGAAFYLDTYNSGPYVPVALCAVTGLGLISIMLNYLNSYNLDTRYNRK